MNRRGFLGGLVAGATAIAVPVAAAKADQGDDFTHNGYRIKWRDFVTPANQNVLVGVWAAKHESQDLQWVSTSLGQCYPSRDWEVIDTTCAKGWPLLTVFSSDAEKAEAKARAKDALLAAVDAPIVTQTPQDVPRQVVKPRKLTDKDLHW